MQCCRSGGRRYWMSVWSRSKPTHWHCVRLNGVCLAATDAPPKSCVWSVETAHASFSPPPDECVSSGSYRMLHGGEDNGTQACEYQEEQHTVAHTRHAYCQTLGCPPSEWLLGSKDEFSVLCSVAPIIPHVHVVWSRVVAPHMSQPRRARERERRLLLTATNETGILAG